MTASASAASAAHADRRMRAASGDPIRGNPRRASAVGAPESPVHGRVRFLFGGFRSPEPGPSGPPPAYHVKYTSRAPRRWPGRGRASECPSKCPCVSRRRLACPAVQVRSRRPSRDSASGVAHTNLPVGKTGRCRGSGSVRPGMAHDLTRAKILVSRRSWVEASNRARVTRPAAPVLRTN